MAGALEQEAFTVKVQCMVSNLLAQNLPGVLKDGVESGVAKFLDPSAIGAKQVVCLASPVAFFVIGPKASKLMMCHQPAFQQQFQGIVNGGPG